MAYEEYYGGDPRIAALIRKRKLAEQLMKTDSSPAATPLVGISRVIQSLVGGFQAGMADDEARKMGEAGDADLARLKAQALGFDPSQPENGLIKGAVEAPQQAMVAPQEAVSRAPLAPEEMMPLFQQASAETGIPVPVLVAQAQVESGFNPNAVSPTGARGVMQVLPSTAQSPGYGVQPVDPSQLSDPNVNIPFAARYLAGRGREVGVTDWNDPAQAAKGLRAYAGADTPQGNPNYDKEVLALVPPQGGAQTMAFSGQPAPQQVGLPAPAQPTPSQAQAIMAEAERLYRAGLEAVNSRNPQARKIGEVMIQRSNTLQSQAQGLMNRADTQAFQQQSRADAQAFQRQTFDLQAQKEAAARGEQRSYEQQQRDAERQYKAVPPEAVFRNLTDKVASGKATPQEEIEYFNAASSWTRGTVNPQTGEVIAGKDLAPPVFRALEAMKARSTPPAQGQPAPREQTDIGGVNVSKAGTTREPPLQVTTGALGNADALRKVRAAMAAIEKTPNAVGRGNYLLPGSTKDVVDPEGVEARARIADLSSLTLHDRAGTAMTAQELERVKPFIPEATDTPDIVKKKLAKMEEEILGILNDQYRTFGPNAGYRALPAVEEVLKMKPGQRGDSTTIYDPADIEAEMKRRGLKR